MKIIYLDGSFLPEDEAKISIFDRGFLFGDGVYATIQVREGVPLFLDSHLKHLQEAAEALAITPPLLSHSLIFDLITKNRAENGIWRLRIIFTGGTGSDNTLPSRKATLVLYMDPFIVPTYRPLKLGVFSHPFSLCHASFKSLAHLNRYYVMEEAKRRGLDDCLTKTEKGFLLEAAFGNLFWIDGPNFYTPSPTLPLYSGMTLQNVRKIAEKLGYQTIEGEFTLEDLPGTALCYRCNTMSGIRPICQIEERAFSQDEKIEQTFHKEYEALIERNSMQFFNTV